MSLKKNNEIIALNIVYLPYSTEEVRHACKSKYNLQCKNQLILLMITDGKKMAFSCCKKIVCII